MYSRRFARKVTRKLARKNVNEILCLHHSFADTRIVRTGPPTSAVSSSTGRRPCRVCSPMRPPRRRYPRYRPRVSPTRPEVSLRPPVTWPAAEPRESSRWRTTRPTTQRRCHDVLSSRRICVSVLEDVARDDALPSTVRVVAVGPVVVSKLPPPSLSEMERSFVQVRAGGTARPANCVARHRVAVIIPFRDRLQHLQALLYNLHPILLRQQIDYQIFVIEQEGECCVVVHSFFVNEWPMHLDQAGTLTSYERTCSPEK